MQFDKEKAVKILTDELCYAYCDNCKNSENIENCDDCHRKYQNWALSPITAEEIVDKIIQLGEIYPVSKEELERVINNAE